jgi:hypothetical protein
MDNSARYDTVLAATKFATRDCGEWCATKGHMIGREGHGEIVGWPTMRRYVTDWKAIDQ